MLSSSQKNGFFWTEKSSPHRKTTTSPQHTNIGIKHQRPTKRHTLAYLIGIGVLMSWRSSFKALNDRYTHHCVPTSSSELHFEKKIWSLSLRKSFTNPRADQNKQEFPSNVASLLEATPVSSFPPVLAGTVLFMEWNMLRCESVEGNVVEEGRTGGWNMFLKIASLRTRLPTPPPQIPAKESDPHQSPHGVPRPGGRFPASGLAACTCSHTASKTGNREQML